MLNGPHIYATLLFSHAVCLRASQLPGMDWVHRARMDGSGASGRSDLLEEVVL